MITPESSHARVFYIMGASGTGKDSLLNYLREHPLHGLKLVFAHRYITRPAQHASENHIALSAAEFQLRASHGCFAMYWHSHHLQYGIGVEIDAWLNVGLHVVVNGSREYVQQAMTKYDNLVPILVCAEPAVVRERLRTRARENDAAIAERVSRGEILDELLRPLPLTRVYNNDSLPEAGQQLLHIIEEHALSSRYN